MSSKCTQFAGELLISGPRGVARPKCTDAGPGYYQLLQDRRAHHKPRYPEHSRPRMHICINCRLYKCHLSALKITN